MFLLCVSVLVYYYMVCTGVFPFGYQVVISLHTHHTILTHPILATQNNTPPTSSLFIINISNINFLLLFRIHVYMYCVASLIW